MAASDTRLTVGMDKTASVPIFTFTDITNYGGLGVTVARGTLRLTSPLSSTAIYDNLNDWTAPDINTTNGTSRANTITVPIPLPLTSTGEIVNGSYLFEYNVRYDATTGAADAANQITMNITYSRVTGDISVEVVLLPLTPSVTVTDNTDYVVDSVTPSTVRALSFAQPTPGTTSVTTASTLVLTSFYTGVWQSALAATNTYNYSSKILTGATNNFTSGYFLLYIYDSANDIVQGVVEGTRTLSDIFCCINEYGQRMEIARVNNPTEFMNNQIKMTELNFLLQLVQMSYQFSVTGSVNDYVARIRQITQCNGTCSDSDGTPILITGATTSTTALSNVILHTTLGTEPSITNLNFTGKTYDSTTRDFMVFVEGIMDSGSFNATTYTYTYSTPLTAGQRVIIVFLR